MSGKVAPHFPAADTPTGNGVPGKVLVLEPLHRLSYTWEARSPSIATVTLELTRENTGTLLHLIHTGIGEGVV